MAALEGEELTTLISRIDIFDCEVRKLTVKTKRFLKPFISFKTASVKLPDILLPTFNGKHTD
jgi:hypothetical protein